MRGLLEVENNVTISTEEVESAESFAILLFLIGLILSLIVAYVALLISYCRYKIRDWSCEYIPEPGLYIIIGFVLSLMVHLSDNKSMLSHLMEKYLVFESDIFFFFLLPIIIFDSGYVIYIIFIFCVVLICKMLSFFRI